MTIHADVALYIGLFEPGEECELLLGKSRHAWVHVARGHARINGHALSAGDAAGLSDETSVRVEGIEPCEVLVFDLA